MPTPKLLTPRELETPPALDLTPATLPASRWERVKRFFALQPFGDEMLTPSIFMWTYAACVLVWAMALLEGCAWGWFGSGIADGWPGVGLGLTVGVVAFLVVWSLDASLMTGDLSKAHAWQKSLLVGFRLALTVFSVWLTAPYLTQFVFRADIQADLHREQNRVIEQARQTIAAQSDAEVAKLNRVIRADREALILEVSGRGRSGRYGDGLTSGAIRERILANEAAVRELEGRKQAELDAFNQAVAQGDLEIIKRRWGVDLPGDSPVERRARLEQVLMRPEAQKTQRTVEGGFWLVCVALVGFKLFLQNRMAAHYFSEDKQALWRQYRKGAFDTWLPPCDRSTGALMSPVTFLAWYEAALPKLRMAVLAEQEAEQARRAADEAEQALKMVHAEFEQYRQAEEARLTDLYAKQLEQDALRSEIFEFEQCFADQEKALEAGKSPEAFRVWHETRKALDEKRAALADCERQVRLLNFQKSEVVDGYNRLARRIEQLEAEVEQRRAACERLNVVARRLRCEVAAVSVGGGEELVALVATALHSPNSA